MGAVLTPGLYRNRLGAELHVIGRTGDVLGNSCPDTIGRIYVAEQRHPHDETWTLLVTPSGMEDAGYVLIEAAPGWSV